MTVPDRDAPDPLNDPAATGEEELAAGQTVEDDAGGGAVTGGGLPTVGGIPDSGGREPEPDVDTGAPFTLIAPPS